jgi:hypothetical protein
MTERLQKYMTQLSRWFADDWEAKIVALVLAVLVWWGVKVLISNDAAEKARAYLPQPGFDMSGKK